MDNIVYRLDGGQPVLECTFPQGYPGPLAFSPDGGMLAVGTDTDYWGKELPFRPVAVYDLASKRKVCSFAFHVGLIRTCQFTPATPVALLPVPPIVPEQWVPWPLSSMGSLSSL